MPRSAARRRRPRRAADRPQPGDGAARHLDARPTGGARADGQHALRRPGGGGRRIPARRRRGPCGRDRAGRRHRGMAEHRPRRDLPAAHARVHGHHRGHRQAERHGGGAGAGPDGARRRSGRRPLANHRDGVHRNLRRPLAVAARDRHRGADGSARSHRDGPRRPGLGRAAARSRSRAGRRHRPYRRAGPGGDRRSLGQGRAPARWSATCACADVSTTLTPTASSPCTTAR
jgi:hypothetical protein